MNSLRLPAIYFLTKILVDHPRKMASLPGKEIYSRQIILQVIVSDGKLILYKVPAVYYFCGVILNHQHMYGSPVLLFFDISGGELLVILVVVFLVFGPEKMPEMARKAGRLMNQMKKASTDLTNEFKKETSVLKNQIDAAHSSVNQELDSVRREVNNTRAQVLSSMQTEPETSTDEVRTESPAESVTASSETTAGTEDNSRNNAKSE